MYCAGNTLHGILNTGKVPLTFYWSKWMAKRRRPVRARASAKGYGRQLSFLTQMLRTDTLVVASISMPNSPD